MTHMLKIVISYFSCLAGTVALSLLVAVVVVAIGSGEVSTENSALLLAALVGAAIGAPIILYILQRASYLNGSFKQALVGVLAVFVVFLTIIVILGVAPAAFGLLGFYYFVMPGIMILAYRFRQ